MGVRDWFARLLSRRKERTSGSSQHPSPAPLREFVYLDEVSLRSLLASQTGAVTEEVSSAVSQAEQAEIAGALSVNSGFLKSEVNPRYQTSNSRSVQTSRKAIAQSLFKEFRELPSVGLLIESSSPLKQCSNLDDLRSCDGTSCIPSGAIVRGSLIEVEVELDVDPVFKLSTLISETSDIAHDYPEAFLASGSASALEAAGPINKVLQRLLAGLIPVRGKAVGLSVVRIGSEEFVVKDDALSSNVKVDRLPLEIVGVTEHLSYWKDIRRVLFSGARFTMLCRVARDGIQKSWTPVKLADLFKDIAPDLAQELDVAGRVGLSLLPTQTAQSPQYDALARALESYVQSCSTRSQSKFTPGDDKKLRALIENLKPLADTASRQKRAFQTVDDFVSSMAHAPLTSQERLELRREARKAAGLELFADSEPVFRTEQASPQCTDVTRALVDTEVIAVYW